MAPFVDLATKVFSGLTLIGDIGVAIVVFALIFKGLAWARLVLGFLRSQSLFLAFVIALGATLGSLFYSEVAGFVPCSLCWWQRLFLYPQVLILGFGLWKKDSRVWNCVLGLSVIGALIAVYNTYLQFGGFSFLPCPPSGVSCAQRYFLEFGYITIPTMSLTAFLLLIVLGLAGKSKAEKEPGNS